MVEGDGDWRSKVESSQRKPEMRAGIRQPGDMGDRDD